MERVAELARAIPDDTGQKKENLLNWQQREFTEQNYDYCKKRHYQI